MNPVARTIREARERTGRTIEEMASVVGLSADAYLDVECYNDEASSVLPLRQLVSVLRTLDLGVEDVFSHPAPHSVSRLQFGELLRQHLVHRGQSVSAFEAAVGWEVASLLDNPESLDAWTLDQLRDVCAVVDVDWGQVVKGMLD